MDKKNNNPWHNIETGEQVPQLVNGIIEIPKESKAKYELDKQTGLLKLDRVLFSSMFYPANYGFIPQTFCEDGDPLDILVLSQISIVPLCVVPSRVIGVMRMLDNGKKDDKILAVAKNDMSVNHLKDIEELPKHLLRELKNFFEDYKKLENKSTAVENFQGIETAEKIVMESIEMYNELIRN